jgi:hypothetical protein
VSHTEPAAVTLTAAEVRLVLYAIGDLISRRWFAKKPLPRGYYALQARLASCVDATKSCTSQPHSSSSKAEELIDTTDAAAILNCSQSWVRSPRFRDKIDGREIGDRWLFPRQSVVEYAERKAVQHK